MTTWVEGLEGTTVGDAGGRPIGFGIDKELKFPKEVWKPSPEKTSLFETQTVKIYYYCPDGDGKLEIRETTPDLVEKGYTAAQTAALGLADSLQPVYYGPRAYLVDPDGTIRAEAEGVRASSIWGEITRALHDYTTVVGASADGDDDK